MVDTGSLGINQMLIRRYTSLRVYLPYVLLSVPGKQSPETPVDINQSAFLEALGSCAPSVHHCISSPVPSIGQQG